MRVLHPGRIWNLEMLVFVEGGKKEESREKPLEQGKKQQTQPMHDTTLQSNPGNIGWEQVLALVTALSILPMMIHIKTYMYTVLTQFLLAYIEEEEQQARHHDHKQ